MIQNIFTLAVLVSPIHIGIPSAFASPALLDWAILAEYPHDPNAFTQGLVYDGHDQLSESVGRYGRSEIRRISLKTGKILTSSKLPDKMFGEGLTKFKDRYLQVTWREGQFFEWAFHKNSWQQKKQGAFSEEGWGLTASTTKVYLTDGSDTIYIKNPDTFKTESVIKVKSGNQKFERLNELEWVDGQIFANIWQSNLVIRIDPKSGDVTGIMDLTKLVPSGPLDPDAVLNGLAWDPDKKILYVTGKLWPKLFALKLKTKS